MELVSVSKISFKLMKIPILEQISGNMKKFYYYFVYYISYSDIMKVLFSLKSSLSKNNQRDFFRYSPIKQDHAQFSTVPLNSSSIDQY